VISLVSDTGYSLLFCTLFLVVLIPCGYAAIAIMYYYVGFCYTMYTVITGFQFCIYLGFFGVHQAAINRACQAYYVWEAVWAMPAQPRPIFLYRGERDHC
jgi:hypothetical protein